MRAMRRTNLSERQIVMSEEIEKTIVGIASVRDECYRTHRGKYGLAFNAALSVIYDLQKQNAALQAKVDELTTVYRLLAINLKEINTQIGMVCEKVLEVATNDQRD